MDKNHQHIRKLLEDFYNGDTSPEEESVLTDFFCSGNKLPEDMEADRKLFCALSNHVADVPADLPANIMKDIERHKSRSRPFSGITMFSVISAAAAVALILLFPIVGNLSTHDMPARDNIATADKSAEISSMIPDEIAMTDNPGKTNDATRDEKRLLKQISTASVADTQNMESLENLSPKEIETLKKGLAIIGDAEEKLAFINIAMTSTDEKISESIALIENTLR